MGLKVETSMTAFKGRTLVDYNWNHGNEYTVTLQDNKGNRERVRVPAYMKDMFEQYFAVTMGTETMAA